MAACNCKLVSSIFLGLLSFIYFILGAAFTAVFAILLSVPTLFGESGSTFFEFSFIVLILGVVSGALLLLASIFGCVIACKRPFCLAILFVIVLTASLALLVAASFIFSSENRDSLSKFQDATPKNKFFDLMPVYWQDEPKRLTLDSRQEFFRCCGYVSYMDWNDTRIVPNAEVMEREGPIAGYIPKSCCKLTTSCKNVEDVHEDGCRDRLRATIDLYKLLIDTSHICFGVYVGIHVLGLVLAIIIAVLVRKERGDDRGQFIPMSNQTSL